MRCMHACVGGDAGRVVGAGGRRKGAPHQATLSIPPRALPHTPPTLLRTPSPVFSAPTLGPPPPPPTPRALRALQLATERLRSMGPMSRDEKIMLGTMGAAVCLWVAGDALGISAVTTAMMGLCVLLGSGVLQWRECLAYPAAWDTLFWFAGGWAGRGGTCCRGMWELMAGLFRCCWHPTPPDPHSPPSPLPHTTHPQHSPHPHTPAHHTP